MAEKRVSVRLVAEGGRQVRAELEGIGDAGARGFGRLSTEMELANTRLASFARKAGIALAAVTVAAAAAGVAMVRSGLETIGAQADMAASLKTTVESLQVLTWAGELAGVSMGEIEQATKKLTTRLSEAAAGSGSAVGALQRLNLTAAELQALPLDQRIVAIQEALNRFVPEAERAAVASDLFGDKAALAFLRIDPATLREAAEDVRDFGVAVSAADAAQIERTGDAIAKLSLIWLGLTNRLTAAVAPALETIANTLADMARSTGPIGVAINALFDNIGRLTTYAATFTLPNTSSEMAILAGTQTFSGNKTFSGSLTASGAVSITGTLSASGTVTVSAAAASIGTAITAATYGMGTGVNPTGVTKTLNLGTGGASGSTTVVNIGSATAGAGGTTVVNTPTVTFANAVTQVGMPQANLTAQLLGLGGATADSFNRLSMNTPAVLLNNAGAGIEATVNKAAAGNDAAFAFKTGFSARALIGLLGNDNFSFKVSPNGSTFFDAIVVDRTNGQVELPQPTVLPGLNAAPTPPPSGKTSVYARNRAGAPWIDVMRPSGRDFPLQPHFGVNRIANWSPSITTTITTEGLPITNVGTVSHPTLAATNLAASMRRWRLTSAAVVDSVSEQRSAGWACWRGNAAGLGGWTFVTRLSLTTLQATGMGFFGLYGSIAALATTLTLAAVINAVGIGFQRGTHANWQLVTNDGTGAPTLTDMGAPFAIALGGVLTLFIAAPPNAASVWVRAVNEVTGAVFEQEITADLPANTQFLSPRFYLNNGATAAAVAYDCAGLYLETDY